ncbi:MAG: cyclic nucleotide-binding domain-containing protein [Bacteriovoracaceae bacterium]
MRKLEDRSVKVLVVDDEKDLLALMGEHLRDIVGRVVAAKDGQEAIQKMNNERFSLLVTDLKMPKVDGIQLATTARKLDNSIPILFISAYLSDHEKEIQTFDHSATLSKPFTLKQLEEKLEGLLIAAKKDQTAEPVLDEKVIKKGQTLFKEGDKGDEMYFIKSGSLDLFKFVNGSNVQITTINTGEIVGELSPLMGAKRSATAIANEDCFLMKIPESKLHDVIHGMPKWLKVLLHTVVGRLSDTTIALANAKKEIEDLKNK